jgi:predicted GIY-YIG superfamily endonuclease
MPMTVTVNRLMWRATVMDFLQSSRGATTQFCILALLTGRLGHAEPRDPSTITATELEQAGAKSGLQLREVLPYTEALARSGWLTDQGYATYGLAIPSPEQQKTNDVLSVGWLILDLQQHPDRLPQPPTVTAAERRCALYFWRDRQNVLLYVGITYDLNVRATAHAATSPWWTFAARQDREWFPTRMEAEAAERAAIRDERPLFNRQHNRGAEAEQRVAEYLTARKRTDLLPASLATLRETSEE